jgi:hypothetical protein
LFLICSVFSPIQRRTTVVNDSPEQEDCQDEYAEAQQAPPRGSYDGWTCEACDGESCDTCVRERVSPAKKTPKADRSFLPLLVGGGLRAPRVFAHLPVRRDRLPAVEGPTIDCTALTVRDQVADAENGIEGPAIARPATASPASERTTTERPAIEYTTAHRPASERTATERTTAEHTAVAPTPRRGAGRIILAIILFIAALALTVVGLTVNTHFAASFGQTAQAAALLAAIGLVIDLLAVVLPSAAAQLWRDRHHMTACGAWSIWVIALAMTLLAAIGFAATNIGDGVAGRSKLAAEATALTADITRLRAERAGIAELRPVATIEAEIQRAQPAAAAVWRQTSGCSDVTLVASGAACAEILKLRQALGTAKRRDALDAELRATEAQLATLPAITTGDPQATMAADILAWASLGHVSLTPHDIHRLRIVGLTIIPALAGIIFMFAVTLLRIGRRRKIAS